MSSLSEAAQESVQRPSWRLSATLAMRDWDGDFIVFNPLSGNTHFLDIVAGQILDRLAGRSMDERELCEQLATFLDVPNGAEFGVEIAGILARLDELGLIEPTD